MFHERKSKQNHSNVFSIICNNPSNSSYYFLQLGEKKAQKLNNINQSFPTTLTSVFLLKLPAKIVPKIVPKLSRYIATEISSEMASEREREREKVQTTIRER